MSRGVVSRVWTGVRRSIFGVNALVSPRLPCFRFLFPGGLDLLWFRPRFRRRDANLAVVPIPEGVERDEEEPADDLQVVKGSGGSAQGSGLSISLGIGKNGEDNELRG